MRISDWSSDVCSSDLLALECQSGPTCLLTRLGTEPKFSGAGLSRINERSDTRKGVLAMSQPYARFLHPFDVARHPRSEEHTSELQSLMRNSYAVFCLQKKKKNISIEVTDDNTHSRLTLE